MDEAESEMRALVAQRRSRTQREFWQEIDLIVDRVGAYAATGVSFEGRAVYGTTGNAGR